MTSVLFANLQTSPDSGYLSPHTPVMIISHHICAHLTIDSKQDWNSCPRSVYFRLCDDATGRMCFIVHLVLHFSFFYLYCLSVCQYVSCLYVYGPCCLIQIKWRWWWWWRWWYRQSRFKTQ